MKRHLRVFLSIIVLGLLVPRCSYLSPAPVSEKTRFTYEIKDEFNVRYRCAISFKTGPRGLLELVAGPPDSIRVPEKRGKSGNDLFDDLEPLVAPDQNGKIPVSRFFKRRGGERVALTGFGPLWLPPCQLRRGQRFMLGPRFGAAVVDTVFTWKSKRLCAVTIGGKETTISGTAWYNASSGFLYSARVTNGSTRYYSPDSIATIMLADTPTEAR